MHIEVPAIDANIPSDIQDLESFRRWARSDDFPRSGRFAFLRGSLWMDLTMGQAYTHNRLKTRINGVLNHLVESGDVGQYFSDGMLLTNSEADISTEPDGLFVSYGAMKCGSVRKIAGENDGCTEFQGAPDMVLEVVSQFSEKKDTIDLLFGYWLAGIPEYWLVDARKALRFTIYRHGPKGYVAPAKQAGGWRKSVVFGRSFHLSRGMDRAGDPKFTLAVR